MLEFVGNEQDIKNKRRALLILKREGIVKVQDQNGEAIHIRANSNTREAIESLSWDSRNPVLDGGQISLVYEDGKPVPVYMNPRTAYLRVDGENLKKLQEFAAESGIDLFEDPKEKSSKETIESTAMNKPKNFREWIERVSGDVSSAADGHSR